MNRARLRAVSAIGLIAGGGLVVLWAVIGVMPTATPPWIGSGILLGSYTCTVLGVGCLGWLAHRIDDAITAGVTPLAIGLALVVPAAIGVTGVVTSFPVPSMLLGITAVGLFGVALGGVVLFTTLLFSNDSTLVAHLWGRAAALIATTGVLGWGLSQGFARPDAPQAFILVTPYTRPTMVAAPGLWVVLVAVTAGGLALCLLGWAVIQQPSGASRTKHPM